MSLKYFHLFFIATALGLMAFVEYWAWPRQRLLAASAAGGFLAALAYLRWFLGKYRTLP